MAAPMMAQPTPSAPMAAPMYANQLPNPGVGADDDVKAKQSWMAVGAGVVAWLLTGLCALGTGPLSLICCIGIFAAWCYPVFVFWCQIPVTQRPAYPKTKTPATVVLGLLTCTVCICILCICVLPAIGFATIMGPVIHEKMIHEIHNNNVAMIHEKSNGALLGHHPAANVGNIHHVQNVGHHMNPAANIGNIHMQKGAFSNMGNMDDQMAKTQNHNSAFRGAHGLGSHGF